MFRGDSLGKWELAELEKIEANEKIEEMQRLSIVFKPINEVIKEILIHFKWIVGISIFIITILLTFLTFNNSIGSFQK